MCGGTRRIPVSRFDVLFQFTVWLAVMLPFLGTKKLSAYVVRYLESLFEMAKNPKRELAESIDAEQLVTIMMWTYDASNGLDAGYGMCFSCLHCVIT